MSSLVQRVVNILKAPKAEWPVIAAEPATVQSLYIPYAVTLAAIGPVAMLLGGGGLGMFRFGGGFLARIAIQQYVISLIAVAVLAFIINALAPSFGSQKDQTQAFKTAIYAYTASWIAGIGAVLGLLATLVALAGGLYSLYLLYVGLPHTMKTPPEKATSYTVVIVIAAIVVSILLGLVAGTVLGTRSALLGGFGSIGSTRQEQVLDPDSALGRLEKLGRDMEQAEKAGKTQDPAQAMGAVMGALAGSGGGPVEALPSDTLKGFIPDSLGGLERRSISAEKNAMLGMQVSHASGRYGEGDAELRLEITDSGGAAGLVALAGWANLEQSSEDGTRTERTGRENSRMVHEEWDSATKRGEYAVVLGDRFVVKVAGGADNPGILRAAAGSVDLGSLEALRDAGKKAQ